MKKSTLLLLLTVQSCWFTPLLSAGEPREKKIPAYYTKYYHHGPIILKGVNLPLLKNYPLSELFLFAMKEEKKAEIILYQFDEIGEKERYVHTHGKSGKESKKNAGILDKNDEICYLASSASPHRFQQQYSIPLEGKVLYELILTNPQNNKKKYAYVAHTKNKIPPVPAQVSYDPAKHEIKTSTYKFYYDPIRVLKFKKVMIKPPKEENYRPLFKENTFSLFFNFKYFFSMAFDENRILSKLSGYKLGPLRFLARVSFSFDLYLFRLPLNLVTEVTFFPGDIVIPAVLNLPIEPQQKVHYGSGLFMGFHLNDPEKVRKDKTNIASMEQLWNYQGKKATDPATFTKYPVLHYFMEMENQQVSIEFHGKNSLPHIEYQLFQHEKKSHPLKLKEFDWLRDHDYDVGFYFEGSELKKGIYFIDIHISFANWNTEKLYRPVPLKLTALEINPPQKK